MDAHAEILRLLRAAQVPYTLHAHPAVRTIEDARAVAPTLVEDLLKTVVLRVKDGPYVLAAVPAAARAHYRLIADALGVRRQALRMVGPAEVETELGFQVGGVGPFPVRGDVVVWVQAEVAGWPRVRLGGGRNTITVELAGAALDRLGVRWAPLVKP